MWIDIKAGSERESCPHDSSDDSYGAFFSGFPWAHHFALPGSESVFGLSQGPPKCGCAFLSQDGF